MPRRPLLMLPSPSNISPPRGGGGGSDLRKPSKRDQITRIGPVFSRLRAVMDGDTTSGMELRSDPSSLSPDRVIVFEIAGTVDAFASAVARVPGMEFLAEVESESQPDQLFANIDGRKGKEGQDRLDKAVGGRLYLAMPDTGAFTQLLSLWERWTRNEYLGYRLTSFQHVFEQLRNVRPWGPQDRIPDETIAYWQDEVLHNPDSAVRTEVELWFHRNETRRTRCSAEFRDAVSRSGGSVVHESVIPEISYHGALIDIPAIEVQRLIEREEVVLAVADEVMFLRPQSLLMGPLETEPLEEGAGAATLPNLASAEPIAALLDGVPLQSHVLLADRLMLDDPDDLQGRAIVSQRIHGTAMASLIIHGDTMLSEPSLTRPLYLRPIMFAEGNQREHSDGNRLLIDIVYQAVIRIKGNETNPAVAPTVFLVNLSIGDERRPFAGIMSPLARLLDLLADQFGILFLVSGGNVRAPITISQYQTWDQYRTAESSERERATLEAINADKHRRTIISPAESLNALTIGAQHHDNFSNRPAAPYLSVDPFSDHLLPNASSGLGLGQRRMIKPDLYLPGGREHVRLQSAGNGQIEVHVAPTQRLYGLMAAAPDPSGQGRLDQLSLSDGTSSATALATRAGHRIFDSLVSDEDLLANIDPDYYGVIVKALLVHRARWGNNVNVLSDICGPAGSYRGAERTENVSRFLGFGVPDVEEAMECSSNRATLIGYGMLEADRAHNYRVPLPACLERVTEPRRLSLTLAWFSPVTPWLKNYRGMKLEARAATPNETFGVDRDKAQPYDAVVKRGSVFHEHYSGNKAVPFIDDGHLALQVWCKEDAGAIGRPVRYGVAITIEAGVALAVYDEIRDRLLIRPRP